MLWSENINQLCIQTLKYGEHNVNSAGTFKNIYVMFTKKFSYKYQINYFLDKKQKLFKISAWNSKY